MTSILFVQLSRNKLKHKTLSVHNFKQEDRQAGVLQRKLGKHLKTISQFINQIFLSNLIGTIVTHRQCVSKHIIITQLDL